MTGTAYGRWIVALVLAGYLCVGVPAVAAAADLSETLSDAELSDDELTEDDREALEALLDLVEEETEIATRTKMNADYIPGIVTVVDRDEAEALGARTVLEALALVPGVMVQRDEVGSPSVRIRGVDFFLNNGNIKVLVDSQTVSRESAGVAGSVLLMPIALVERIEVIRGPGSGVHGDFAFAGLVNIVTARRSAGWLGVGKGDVREGGLSWQGAAGSASEGTRLGLGHWRSTVGDAPGGLDADEERSFVTGEVEFGGFTLGLTALRRDHLSDRAPGRRPAGERSHTVGLSRTWVLADGDPAHAGVGEHSLRADLWTLDNDVFTGTMAFEGDQFGAAVEWAAHLGRHRFLAQVRHVDATIDRARETVPGRAPVVLADVDRDASALMVQDQVELGRVTVTATLRYDEFSDVDGVFSPRLAGVWRLNDHHALKLQVAQGFRAPTFFELYGTSRLDPDLDVETQRTTEIGYVHRRPDQVTRVTIFRSDLDDLIVAAAPTGPGPPGGGPGGPGGDPTEPPAGPRFVNDREATAEGVELEWSRSVGERWKWRANVGYVHTVDERTERGARDDSFGAADWISNLAVLYRPARPLLLGLHWHHVGDRAQAGPADRDGYDAVHLTATVRSQRRPGLALRLGLRNLLDDHVSTSLRRPTGDFDLEFDERSVTAQLEMSF